MRIIERSYAREKTTEYPRAELNAGRVACGGYEAGSEG